MQTRRKSRLEILLLGIAGVAAALVTFLILNGGMGEDDSQKTVDPLAGFDNTGEARINSSSESDHSSSAIGTPAPVPGTGENFSTVPDGQADGGSGTGTATGASGVGGVGATGGGGSSLPSAQVLDRKIVRNATLDVVVEDVLAAARSVEARAVAAGGFVSASNVSVEAPPEPQPVAEGEPAPTPAPERQRADVEIRVPSEGYEAVMSDLRALGDVRTESSTTSEVTEEYTDLEARLRNLQASEQQYLGLLARAAAIPDIITVQDRLNAVRLEIEQVQGQLQLLNDLTDLATIDIAISLPPVAVEMQTVAAEPGWAQEAWDNAWERSQRALETLGTIAISAGVVLVWILVPAILLGIGWRVFTAIGRRGAAT